MCSPERVVETARRMAALGLVVGSFGNVSCRLADKILITPTGLDYSAMEPMDIVTLDLEGERLVGQREPSSEFRLHLALYRARADARAVVHTHSVHAIALSLVADELPPLSEELEHGVGGTVPVAPYAPAGTEELGRGAATTLLLGESRGLILARHGVVGLGRDLDEALLICQLVERNARVYLLAKGLTPSSPPSA
ncbi:MAG: class II aldolase/adducin family protein [Candidatus Bipolaricaulia bacterium]